MTGRRHRDQAGRRRLPRAADRTDWDRSERTDRRGRALLTSEPEQDAQSTHGFGGRKPCKLAEPLSRKFLNAIGRPFAENTDEVVSESKGKGGGILNGCGELL